MQNIIYLSTIVSGKKWRSLDFLRAQLKINTMAFKQMGSSKLNKEQVLEIRKLYATGKYTQKELSLIYNVKSNSISCIVNGLTWKNI